MSFRCVFRVERCESKEPLKEPKFEINVPRLKEHEQEGNECHYQGHGNLCDVSLSAAFNSSAGRAERTVGI